MVGTRAGEARVSSLVATALGGEGVDGGDDGDGMKTLPSMPLGPYDERTLMGQRVGDGFGDDEGGSVVVGIHRPALSPATSVKSTALYAW